jgi:hypothetical protein
VKAQRAAAVTTSVLSDVVAAPVDTVRAPTPQTRRSRRSLISRYTFSPKR